MFVAQFSDVHGPSDDILYSPPESHLHWHKFMFSASYHLIKGIGVFPHPLGSGIGGQSYRISTVLFCLLCVFLAPFSDVY